MRSLWLSAVLVLMLAASGGSAHAEQSGNGAINSVLDFLTPDERSVNINRAIADEIGRQKGYGPGDTNVHQEIENQTINNTHNGPETSSTAVEIVNSNSSTTSMRVGSGNSNVTFNATTGSEQISGVATQNATAQATVTTDDSTADVDATTSANDG